MQIMLHDYHIFGQASKFSCLYNQKFLPFPGMMIRGLVIDKKFGNIVKPNRFGYVKRAFHGTKPFDLMN
jgi:hypothetical protein